MTTIAAIHTARVSRPVRSDLVVRGARGAHDRSDYLLVRVVTSDDVEGFGEVSATPRWSGEDGSTAAHIVADLLRPALIGQPLVPGVLDRLMDQVVAGNPFTKAGVSMALWDAHARALGVPLAVALGGPFRDEVPIKCSLSGDGANLDAVYAAAAAAGFGAFKVKVGLGVPGDVARVARARELVGDAFLGVDANGGWSRGQAMRAVRELVPYHVAFVEQPVAPDDLDGMRAVRAAPDVPAVVADESVFSLPDLARLIRADAADAVSIYVGKAGGPARAVDQARVAATFGMDVLIGSNGEFGLGAAAQIHVACAVSALSAFPSDIIGAFYYEHDVLATPLDSDGTRVRLPHGPGLGVDLADDVMKEFR
jgi:L-alanine-DL-glutamate epimerase-like enolase superfamily enzyme